MGSRGLSRGVKILTAATVGALCLQAATARAALNMTASRSELFYSDEADPDCSTLSKLPDDQLPTNVVRLRAVLPAGVDPTQVRFRWSLPKPQLGTLAADLDLGPSDTTAAVRGLCAEFGNSCILTGDKLGLYSQATVLWLAPTCSVLPDKTARRFAGGRVRVGVQAFVGKRKIGKAVTVVGFGRTASITLYIDGSDGIGKPFGVPSDIRPFFSARLDAAGTTLPELDTIQFEDGAGASTSPTPPVACTVDGVHYDACANTTLYRQAGKFKARATAKFVDKSDLCDDVTVRVLSADIIPKLEVSATPRRSSYVPGDPRKGVVNLRVVLRNASPHSGGSSILLAGGSILTCNAELKAGGTTATQMTTFDLQHCSQTTDQPCTRDGHCAPPVCSGCSFEEFCLTGSHCSETLTQACTGNSDCEVPTCKTCQDNETCIHVLATPEILLGIGDAVELVNKTVAIANTLPNPAKVSESWTVNTFNAGSDSAELKYKLLGRPLVPVGGSRH